MTTSTLTKGTVLEALKDVFDPEIPVNVVDLGLVYDCEVEDGDVRVARAEVRYEVGSGVRDKGRRRERRGRGA